MTLDLLSRVRLTAAAKAENFDHRLDEQVGTVYNAGEKNGVPWAEVAWERRCSWHKAADLELIVGSATGNGPAAPKAADVDYSGAEAA